MPKEYTHTECFAVFGTVPRNTRWSWSGRSDNGENVAVTLWQDRFEEGGRFYRWKVDRDGAWTSRPGFVELIDNLIHACDHLDGVVHVIMAKARDTKASPRSIERCFPHPSLKMRVVEINQDEGTFVLERIEPTQSGANAV